MKLKLLLFITLLSLCFCLSSNSASATLIDNMLLYYTFDNGDFTGNDVENIKDTSIYNATNIGSATGLDGIIEEAFETDSSGEYVRLPTNIDIFLGNNNFSINIWANWTQTGKNPHLFAMFGDSNFYVSIDGSSNRCGGDVHNYILIASGVTCTGVTAPQNRWMMFTLTYNNTGTGKFTLYVNGTAKATQTGHSFSAQGIADNIGNNGGGTADYFGSFDEFAIWNRTLTQAEITELYNNHNAKRPSFDLQIVQNTFNVTSATGDNQTEWRTNTNNTVFLIDSTPTVKFNLTLAGNCSMGTQDQNYTDMISTNSDRECSVLDSIEQTCTLPNSDKLSLGNQKLYISCVNTGGTQYLKSNELNITLESVSAQTGEILLQAPKTSLGNTTFWAVDFGLTTGSVPAYDNSCGIIDFTPSGTKNTLKSTNLVLNYNFERSPKGRAEISRVGFFNNPKRFYSDTFRAYFSLNSTLNANQSYNVNLNITEVLSNTGLTGTNVDTTTYRLYRFSPFGGIFNDTGICYEQPVTVG